MQKNYGDIFVVNIEDLPKGSGQRVKVKCDYCGAIYDTEYCNYNRGRKAFPKDCCSKCAPKKTNEIRKIKIAKEKFKILNDFCSNKNYILLTKEEEYTSCKMKIRYICPIHGEQEIMLDSMVRGHGCQKCARKVVSNKLLKTQDEVKQIIESYGNEWLNKGEYKGVNVNNLIIRCGKCGNVYTTRVSHLLKGINSSCSICTYKTSINEEKIINLLKENNIEFEQEKRFSDCKYKRSLPFDFYIPKYNLIIEYDGEGHYLSSFYKNRVLDIESALKERQRNDKIKNEYCENNGIELLRIPYWEKNNLEKIILQKIKQIKQKI